MHKADNTASRPRAEGGLSHTKNIESNTVQPREGGSYPLPATGGRHFPHGERAPGCSGGEVARMRSEYVGHVVGFPGIQASVCYKTTEIQRCFDISSRGRSCTGVTERNRFSFTQKRDQSGPDQGESTGVLLLLLPHSKERGSTASHSGSACVKQSSEEIHVQNVKGALPLVFHYFCGNI